MSAVADTPFDGVSAVATNVFATGLRPEVEKNVKTSRRSPASDAGSAAPSAPSHHNMRIGIEYRPIDQLRNYRRKLRTRSPEDQLKLRTSVSAFGLLAPILIQADGTILDGEALVEAARDLGYREVPTVTIDHLSEGELRLVRIGLKKLPQSGSWNELDLGFEMMEIEKLELPVGLEITGFDSMEIDSLIQAAAKPEEDEEGAELVIEGPAVSRLGDLWHCDGHQILCGNSLERDGFERLMGEERARMVCTDHPYNLKQSEIGGNGKHKHREFFEAAGEMSEIQFTDFLTRSIGLMAEYTVDGGLCYFAMDWKHMWEMQSAIRANKLKMMNLAVWVKTSGGMGSFYRSQHELFFIVKTGSGKHINNIQLGKFGRNRTNCWSYPGMSSFGSERDDLLSAHSTPKNRHLIADAIRDVTDRGDIVLDGFLGSGTTLIAAERTGRRCRAIEIDPLYVDGAIRRWEKASGKSATLSGSGKTFAEVAAERAAASEAPAPVRCDTSNLVIRPRQRAAA